MSHSPRHVSKLSPKALKLAPKSMVRAGAEVKIKAGLEPIWSLLADPNGWSSWYGGVKQSKGSTPLESGSKLSFKAGPTAFNGRVDELAEASLLRFSGKSPGSSATYLFQLEPDGKNTRVLAAVSMKGVAIMAAKPIMQGVAEKAVLRWLDALAEATASAD